MSKILIIPSWYPYPGNPLAGKFFVQQAYALAKYSRHEVYIWNFGQNEYQIKVRHPIDSWLKLHCLIAYTHSHLNKLDERLWEVVSPHLSWTSKFRNGNLDNLALPSDVKPDIIYAQVTYPAGYLAWKLSQKLGVPYLISEHSGPFPFPEFAMRNNRISDLILQPLQAANKVVAVSTFLAKQILESTGVVAEVIPNMVDTDFFVPSPNIKAVSRLRLFSMSAFTKAKGVTDLLKALIYLDSQGVDFHMEWAGDGPLLKHIMQKAKVLGHKVRFWGWIAPEQALPLYQNCDVYIMPSRIESFSIVLIEALSCGKPIIATDCGGPGDIINERNGYLVPVKNAKAMALAIMAMKENLDCYDSDYLHESCVARYSEESVSSRLLRELDSLISQ